ncbi:hypothetical protein P7K49_024632 [Saguinus oedipus]|uniref:Uncharacterized protein n=1 Tax=Saguinus oedipus TaxID=9490 RepID=A0ABQ9UQ15_SAGOE|nr:hypothetical protein P7K49_024632 [Saguinus oedipus]
MSGEFPERAAPQLISTIQLGRNASNLSRDSVVNPCYMKAPEEKGVGSERFPLPRDVSSPRVTHMIRVVPSLEVEAFGTVFLLLEMQARLRSLQLGRALAQCSMRTKVEAVQAPCFSTFQQICAPCQHPHLF